MLRHLSSHEIFTILIVISLIFIALAKILFQKRFSDFIYVLGNSRYLKIYVRDQKFLDVFDALLFGNLLLTLSIFCFIAISNGTEPTTISLTLLIKLIVGIGVFILIKVLIERLIGSLFEIDEYINQYVFQKISYKNFIGIVLLPINAILLFGLEPTRIIIYVILVFLIVLNLIGLITSYKTHQKLIKRNFFYFILYLCALEISPFIILFKFIESN